MNKPLDVRLHDAAVQASRLLAAAAGTPHTKSNFMIEGDPADDTTTVTIVFTILHTGEIAVERSETPQEPAQRVVEPAMEEAHGKARVGDAPPPNFPEQTPCQRCHLPRWKHTADDKGGFAACKDFVDTRQAILV